jgi:outer membrane protein assembly factor BamB
MTSNTLFVGVNAHVVAIDKSTGATLWQTKLKGGLTSGARFVSLLVQDGRVYAHTYGELFCLDQETGAILWKNGLGGLGYDMATLASEGASGAPMEIIAAQRVKQTNQAGTTFVIGSDGH